MTTLLDLPVEALDCIADQLDPHSAGIFRYVCSRTRDIRGFLAKKFSSLHVGLPSNIIDFDKEVRCGARRALETTCHRLHFVLKLVDIDPYNATLRDIVKFNPHLRCIETLDFKRLLTDATRVRDHGYGRLHLSVINFPPRIKNFIMQFEDNAGYEFLVETLKEHRHLWDICIAIMRQYQKLPNIEILQFFYCFDFLHEHPSGDLTNQTLPQATSLRRLKLNISATHWLHDIQPSTDHHVDVWRTRTYLPQIRDLILSATDTMQSLQCDFHHDELSHKLSFDLLPSIHRMTHLVKLRLAGLSIPALRLLHMFVDCKLIRRVHIYDTVLTESRDYDHWAGILLMLAHLHTAVQPPRSIHHFTLSFPYVHDTHHSDVRLWDPYEENPAHAILTASIPTVGAQGYFFDTNCYDDAVRREEDEHNSFNPARWIQQTSSIV